MIFGRKAIGALALLWLALVAGVRVDAQIGGRPTRPQVKPPQGAVRAIIFKNCTSCHGIDDYAFNALDKEGWNRHPCVYALPPRGTDFHFTTFITPKHDPYAGPTAITRRPSASAGIAGSIRAATCCPAAVSCACCAANAIRPG